MQLNVQGIAPAIPSELGHPAYAKIRDLIYQSSGIYQPDEKLYLLASRCARRMTDTRLSGPSEYLNYLVTHESRGEELRTLLNEVTIGETYMFRSPQQLEALRGVVLPQLAEAKAGMGFKRLRIWSAGCSTGEEPYTLAILLSEQRETLLKGWSFDILATDINDNSLAAARAGIYGEYALRNATPAIRSRYFAEIDSKHWQVKSHLKDMIRFERVNLGDDSRMVFLKGMHIIFCCNVLIYFSLASKRKVVQHFHSNLMSDGYLFLGHAESLLQVDDRFRLVHFPGAIGYCKPSIGFSRT